MAIIEVKRNMNRAILLCSLVLAANGLPASAFAATIHKWVDENGITHYSDQPPEAATSVTRFEIDERGYSSSGTEQESDRFYSIANQWKRINQERLQRLQLALQQAALEADTQDTASIPRHAYDERADRNIIVYTRRAYRRHGYHNGRHYLHSYRPGGRPYLEKYRSTAFPTVN